LASHIAVAALDVMSQTTWRW